MELIPAIDIINGQCVRLTQGHYEQKTVYDRSPLEVAKQFEDHGICRIHLVDLDGARNGKIVNWKILEQIAKETSLIIDFGGGIQTDEDIRTVYASGAKIATVGSMAVTDPVMFAKWVNTFGANAILLGADVRQEKLAIKGWLEQTDLSVFDFTGDMIKIGVRQMFCTDVAKDGKLQGPSTDLYKALLEQHKDIHLIASGGIRSLDDLQTLKEIGCSGAIIGKALYEGHISLKDLSTFH